jgi:hypothetical protein
LIIAFVLISESASAQISRSIPIQQLEATLVTINSAATDVVSFSVGFPKYIVRRVIIYDASTSLVASAATLGIFTGAGGTGTTVVALTTMTALTATTKRLDTSLTLTSDYLTSNILFVRCGTAHGSAATVTVVIEIQVIP